MERLKRKVAALQALAQLLQRLKDQGHYPYSDLDRKPVA